MKEKKSGEASSSRCGDGKRRGKASSEKKKKKFTEFNPRTDFAAPEFKLGIVSSTVEDFKKAVWEYAIMSKREMCVLLGMRNTE